MIIIELRKKEDKPSLLSLLCVLYYDSWVLYGMSRQYFTCYWTRRSRGFCRTLYPLTDHITQQQTVRNIHMYNRNHMSMQRFPERLNQHQIYSTTVYAFTVLERLQVHLNLYLNLHVQHLYLYNLCHTFHWFSTGTPKTIYSLLQCTNSPLLLVFHSPFHFYLRCISSGWCFYYTVFNTRHTFSLIIHCTLIIQSWYCSFT